jgi:hypothetical protein
MNYISNFTEKFSSRADSHLTGQVIPCPPWNPKVLRCAKKNLPLDPILSQPIPVHTFTATSLRSTLIISSLLCLGLTKLAAVAVMLYTYMWKILGFNCGRHTGYPYCGFPQLLQASVKILS